MVTCQRCGDFFERKYAWQKFCWNCWREKKDREIEDAAYRRGYADGLAVVRRQQPRQANGTPADLSEYLPRLLQLCHPDRHGNSDTATKVTQFLLSLRKRYRNATTN